MNAVMVEASVGGLTVSPAWRCGLHIPLTLLLTLQLTTTKSSHIFIRVLLFFLLFLPRVGGIMSTWVNSSVPWTAPPAAEPAAALCGTSWVDVNKSQLAPDGAPSIDQRKRLVNEPAGFLGLLTEVD